MAASDKDFDSRVNNLTMIDFNAVCNLVDEELARFSKEKNGTSIKFDIYTTLGQQALEIIEQHNLITFRGSDKAICIADITLNGEGVIASGGLNTYLDSLGKKVQLKEEKESLEFEKMQSELVLLKMQIVDFNANKWKTNLAI
jgi:hypothetical protein